MDKWTVEDKQAYLTNLGTLVSIFHEKFSKDMKYYIYSSTARVVMSPYGDLRPAHDIDIQMCLNSYPVFSNLIYDKDIQERLNIDPLSISFFEKRNSDVGHISRNISFFMQTYTNKIEVDAWFDASKGSSLLNYCGIKVDNSIRCPIVYKNTDGIMKKTHISSFSPEDSIQFYRYVLREEAVKMSKGLNIKPIRDRLKNMELIRKYGAITIN